jgi:hypothetical protein
MPVLQAGTISGYTTLLWGRYPALIPSSSNINAITHGMAYEVRKEEHLELLRKYETDAYVVTGCRIHLVDEKEVDGRTFIWNAGTEELKEGGFDPNDWEMEEVERGRLG